MLKKVLYGLILAVIWNCSPVYADQITIDFTSSNLPIVKINTNGREIPPDNPRITAEMGIIYNGIDKRNSVSDPPNNYSGRIRIETRGHTSAGWAKKQYALETINEDGSNRNVSLLGLPEENDWILNGPYYDRSFIRNVLVYKLARDMGWYAPRTKYCELVLNDEYRGIYILMEKIKQDKNRVNISKLKPDDISGDELTGGYIVKIDNKPWNPGFSSKYPRYKVTWEKVRYQYYDPKAPEMVQEQKDYIESFILEFEDVMTDDNYADPQEGYPKYINVESFVDYFILNELSKTVDAYLLSAFFYKDRDSKGGKLTAGPVWDYNVSFGNAAHYNSENVTGWILADLIEEVTYGIFQVPFWWPKLVTEPAFTGRIINRWWELREDVLDIDNLHRYIDELADTLDEAQERNFKIWIGPGDPKAPGDGYFPPSDPIDDFETYQDEIDYLKSWVERRILWIDETLAHATSITLD